MAVGQGMLHPGDTAALALGPGWWPWAPRLPRRCRATATAALRGREQFVHVELQAPAGPIPSLIPVPVLAVPPQGAGTPWWGRWPGCPPVPSSCQEGCAGKHPCTPGSPPSAPGTAGSGGPWLGVPSTGCHGSSPTHSQCGLFPPLPMEGLPNGRTWDTMRLLQGQETRSWEVHDPLVLLVPSPKDPPGCSRPILKHCSWAGGGRRCREVVGDSGGAESLRLDGTVWTMGTGGLLGPPMGGNRADAGVLGGRHLRVSETPSSALKLQVITEPICIHCNVRQMLPVPHRSHPPCSGGPRGVPGGGPWVPLGA